MYVGKTVLRSDIFVKPGKMEGPPLGDLGGPLCRQRALQMQRLGGGSEFRTEQRPLWLSSEADVEGVGGRGDVGTSQTTIFWATERTLGFILLGPVNPQRVLSRKPRALIFKSSPDLNMEMESSSPFILPLGMARRREPLRGSVWPVGTALSQSCPVGPLEEQLSF